MPHLFFCRKLLRGNGGGVYFRRLDKRSASTDLTSKYYADFLPHHRSSNRRLLLAREQQGVNC
jgi:hypothetical protein